MSVGSLARYAWALPNTLIGLLFLIPTVVSGGAASVVDGVLEISGGMTELFLRRCMLLQGGVAAMTLGHVVLGRSPQMLEETRRHERVHVRQCEVWGPMFLPAYVVASLIAVVGGGHGYRDNYFEREAFGQPLNECN